MKPVTTLDAGRCVVRSTHLRRGRSRSLDPSTTAARQLRYGRIILEPADAPVAFANSGMETALVALRGQALVAAGGKRFTLAPYDTLYVPRDVSLEARPGTPGCDLAEIAAPVDGVYPLRLVPWAEVQSDPGLHFTAGASPTRRTVNILVGKNVQAGRLLCGVTFSEAGGWTSWPPHEHAQMLEEAYLYVDMPAPAWGIQLVYTNPQAPELAVVVREGDVVLMPAGYHPNVAAPGGAINFLWMMAAHREGADRQFGVVNVQPEYAAAGSGLEPGRTSK